MGLDSNDSHKTSLIRSVSSDDLKGLARVHVDSWCETYRDIIPKTFLESLKYTDKQEMWERLVPRRPEDGDTLIIYDHEENDVIGFADFGRAREHEHGFPGEIYALYLLKRFHGQGLGRELFEKVKETFREMKIDSFYLWVLEENPTKEFYKKAGGKFLKSQPVEIGGITLVEELYYWKL
jgi:GNAT superfamily N-acetyltransferase